MGMTQQVMHDADRIAAQRTPVFPPFAEGEFQIADGRPMDRQLSVMPWWSWPIHRRHRLTLPVAAVVFAVAPAVAEVDAPDKSDVIFGLVGVPDDHQLLVMRSAQTHSLVEQNLTPSCVDLLAEVAVLRGAESEPIQVRAPDQSSNDHASSRCVREYSPNLTLGAVAQPLVRVAAPVGEVQLIAGLQIANGFQQAAEVHVSVHQRFDPVAGAPCRPVRSTSVKRCEVVAALGARQIPAAWHAGGLPQLPHPEVSYCLCYWSRSTLYRGGGLNSPAVDAGRDAVKRAAASPALRLLERLGYLARGALYAVMGLLALAFALGVAGGETTDLSGSLVFLIANPFGKVVLIVMAIGLAAYSLWGFIRAAYDPLHRGSDASGYMARFGFVTSALSYAAIVVFALQILAGSAGASGDGTKKTIGTILTHPGGGWVTVLIGLAGIGVGLGQFLEAYRAEFARDLKGAEMTKTARARAIALGRLGMFARGVVLLVIGWFLVQAGLYHDAGRVQGFGGAFSFLLGQPFGRVLLGVVALGFVALGLYSFACARWIRLMGSSA
jgi:hypothetical protein